MRRWLKRWTVVVTVLLVVKATCVVVGAPPTLDDELERLNYVTSRLEAETPEHDLIAGEWFVVSISMSALAAMNLATTHPELRTAHRVLVEKLAYRALRDDVRRFDGQHWGADPLATLETNQGHAGYLGHLALTLGAECELGSSEHATQRLALEAALRRRFEAKPLLETYPTEVWIPDNAAALAGLELMARCEGRHAPPVHRQWPVEEKTGVLRFMPKSGARGSGAGFNALYLPIIDAAFAREQFVAAQRTFRFGVLGLAAWKEFPEGFDGVGDVDSGPLVFGLSPSATGFAMAGADEAERVRMLRTAEVAGFTVSSRRGRHYALAPLVGEAAVLAAKTTPR